MCNALVDDVVGNLSEPIDVCLSRAEVATLNRVVEKAIYGVTVIAIVLRCIDPALRSDGVGATRGVLIAEAFHLVTKLGQSGGSSAAREAGTDDDDVEFPLVGRVDELGVHLVAGPFLLKRASGDFAIEGHRIDDWRLMIGYCLSGCFGGRS